jgi:hypothetical protein
MTVLPQQDYKIKSSLRTKSPTLWEDHRLRVFVNKVLRRIFGPKREKVVGGWRRLRRKELHKSYVSPNVIRLDKRRGMRWVGHSLEREKTHTKFWFGDLKGKTRGRHRRRG